VTAIASPPDERWRKLWTRYAAGGGKLKLWISQCHGNPEQMLAEIDRSVEAGAAAIFIQGARVEEQFGKGNFDLLRTWIEYIREPAPGGGRGALAGGHPELERRGFPTGFLLSSMYNASKTSGLQPRGAREGRCDDRAAEEAGHRLQDPGGRTAHGGGGIRVRLHRIKARTGFAVGIYAQNAIDQIRQNATYTEMLTGA